VGDVGAEHDEQQHRGDQRRPERGSHGRHHAAEHRFNAQAEVRIGVREVTVDGARDDVDFGLRPLPCRIRRQPGDHLQPMEPPVCLEAAAARDEQRPGVRAKRQLGAPRQHAHDLDRLAVELHAAAGDGIVGAEAAAPEALADDDHVVAARPVVIRSEQAAAQGCHAERVEERARDQRSGEALGSSVAGDVGEPES
jgi:hypothetical protein